MWSPFRPCSSRSTNCYQFSAIILTHYPGFRLGRRAPVEIPLLGVGLKYAHSMPVSIGNVCCQDRYFKPGSDCRNTYLMKDYVK